MAEPEDVHPLDDPEKKRRTVRTLVVLSPGIFVLCWLLSWVQGADGGTSLLIAAVGAGMCLGTALTIQLLGSHSWIMLVAVKIAAMLMKTTK